MMRKLTILQINDTHSYMELHNEVFYGPQGVNIRKAGGYARIQTLVESLKENGKAGCFFWTMEIPFMGRMSLLKQRELP